MSNISELSFKQTMEWIKKNRGRVYCCTLNELMMAREDKKLEAMINSAEVLTPDGMPLVWNLRRKGKKAERVYGPDLMRAVLENGGKDNVFIGDSENEKYFSKFGKYIVAPYKEKFEEADYQQIIMTLKDNRKKIVWVGLGARKQIEMADRLFREIPENTYVTVGAAFDFLSGQKKQAPKWIRNNGGEWLFRLIMEPRRLAKRYLRIIGFIARRLFLKEDNSKN